MNQIRSFLAIVSFAAATVQIAPAQPVVFTVLKAASSNAFVCPGCWISIYGANLATTTQTANGALTPTLGGK
jgi:membrane protein YqaA with SNARE-associated domain